MKVESYLGIVKYILKGAFSNDYYLILYYRKSPCPPFIDPFYIQLNHLSSRRCGFDPWVGKTLWRREWQPTPVLMPGELHGQRSLVGYSPWDPKELEMTERLTLS